MPVTTEIALRMVAAAQKKAEEIGVPMVIAVVDQGGNLLAQVRMDDALLVSIDLSLNKAYTAVAAKMSTETLCSVSQPGGELYGIHNADNGRIVIFGGGLPIEKNGKVIGGIGVSGGSVAQDTACAEAGLAAFK
ncbi:MULTISPECIES: GlcG/HbpS family heme-binding protein [unclassified Maridesulfovibrio]|uniref:GlcG/HbpS family heme-binding protein n=1 Tax=unclassified Maridesulfovibrio TaxID=2794999 RepID=UPI003B3FF25E